MSPLGIVAFVTGTLGVVLTIRQNIYCWPAALISVVAAAIDFYNSRLYGDAGLQVFYFFAGVYGWYYWNRKTDEEFVVGKMPSSLWIVMCVVTVVQFVIYYYL